MPEIFSKAAVIISVRRCPLIGHVYWCMAQRPILPSSQTKTPASQTTTKPAPITDQQNSSTAEKGKEKSGATAAGGASKVAKGKFTMKVGSGPLRGIDLKANEAIVAEIAQRLAKEFDIPVLLSPVMQKAHVSIDFEGMPLEGAVRLIAPQPYADYEISGDGSTMSKMVALYLYALNEPPPSESAVVRGDSRQF